jgi:hypothetical protein
MKRVLTIAVLLAATALYFGTLEAQREAAQWEGCMFGCAARKLGDPACNHLACDACQNTCELFRIDACQANALFGGWVLSAQAARDITCDCTSHRYAPDGSILRVTP